MQGQEQEQELELVPGKTKELVQELELELVPGRTKELGQLERAVMVLNKNG